MRVSKSLGIVIGIVAIAWSIAVGAQDMSDLPPDLAAEIQAAQMKDEAAKDAGQVKDGEEAAEPQPRKSWEELIEQWMTPMPVIKASVVKLNDKYAYPHPAVPVKMEIVGEDDENYWLVGLSPENPESAMHKMWLKQQETEVMLRAKREFDRNVGPGRFLDFSEPIVPPATVKAVDFKSAGGGLPVKGKWQMGFDVVDMNGDGELDLVLPPPRLGQPAHPSIYLGDGSGDFRYWKDVRWTRDVPFDYGDVKVADFDGDGYLDVVIAIHFKGQYVVYGSENHEFRRSKKLPSPDPRVTSRATTVADFDGDGRLDVAFLAELDMDLSQNKRLKAASTVWIAKNTEKGWQLANVEGLPKYVIGDGIRATDVNGDGRQDIVLASTAGAWRALVYINRLPEKFEVWDESDILGGSFHYGVRAVGSDASRSNGAVYAAYQQFVSARDGKKTRTGVVKYAPVDGSWKDVSSTVVFTDDERYNYCFRIAVGDIDGDGLEDIVVSRKKGGIEVWLQASGGAFYKNIGSDLDAMARAYDLTIVDIDGDGRGDIVASLAELAEEAGGVRVWMSRPVN